MSDDKNTRIILPRDLTREQTAEALRKFAEQAKAHKEKRDASHRQEE